MYRYGEEISYNFKLLRVEDRADLQLFTCGNQRLDNHIRNDVIGKNEIVDEDGLYFICRDIETNDIIAVFSLASSGIIYKVDNYTHLLPAIKVDVLAVDEKYQKMHFDKFSEETENPDDHYFFSDDIMGTIIRHCRNVSEKDVLAGYIVLYADKKAYRYYERNGFQNYSEFMLKENNQEINQNIPMYMPL